MKYILHSIFMWKDKSGVAKSNDTSASISVYKISRSGDDLPVITDITSSCGATQSAIDATSGLHKMSALYNDTNNTNIERFIAICRSTADDNETIELIGNVPKARISLAGTKIVSLKLSNS
jgi:hypothetical protein